MKALSIKQPYAWAILFAGKDIENRSRRTHYRGTIAVHASMRPDKDWVFPRGARKPPPPEEWDLGAILGFVDIVDCVDNHPSRWFIGRFGYVLSNVRVLDSPVPCKGQRGFWEVPASVLRRCRTGS